MFENLTHSRRSSRSAPLSTSRTRMCCSRTPWRTGCRLSVCHRDWARRLPAQPYRPPTSRSDPEERAVRRPALPSCTGRPDSPGRCYGSRSSASFFERNSESLEVPQVRHALEDFTPSGYPGKILFGNFVLCSNPTAGLIRVHVLEPPVRVGDLMSVIVVDLIHTSGLGIVQVNLLSSSHPVKQKPEGDGGGFSPAPVCGLEISSPSPKTCARRRVRANHQPSGTAC